MIPPTALLAEAERVWSQVPASMVDRAVSNDDGTRRVALLDLVWLERSLNIAFSGSRDYKRVRDHSSWFAITRQLADIERRHPVLSWSEIAIYHPVRDPRSFLTQGEDRDQEILMYRTQGEMERAFVSIVHSATESDFGGDPLSWVSGVAGELDAVLRAMIHLSRVRRVGQFYKLDPFLSPNNEYIGHGTGAFSIWTFLVAQLVSSSPHVAERIRNPANHRAFDRDADPYVQQVIDGTFPNLRDVLGQFQGQSYYPELLEKGLLVQKKFSQFLRTHRGAMRKHSPTSFAYEAPSYPSMSNGEAIDRAIDEVSRSHD